MLQWLFVCFCVCVFSFPSSSLPHPLSLSCSLSFSPFPLAAAAARAGGASTANGVEMFVGQAAAQFRLFTDGVEPPVELMTKVVVDSLKA